MELYINNTKVDLEKRVPFPLTYQISDIRELEKRKGNSSKTIALPGTRINTKLFGHVFHLSASSSDSTTTPVVYDFDPSKKAPARYYENGVLVFSGVAQLTECIKNNDTWTFNIVLLSDTVDYMSDFKNVKLRELGWSEYNHNLIYANQQQTWSGTIQKNGVNYNNSTAGQWFGEGYYYGLIDYGYDRPSGHDSYNFECDDIPPQVFLKSILDKLFESAGITYTSTFFGSQLFKKCLMAYEGGVLPNVSDDVAANNSIETDQINNGSGYLVDQAVEATPWYGLFFTDQTTIPGYIVAFDIDYSSDSGTNVDTGNHIQTSDPLLFVSGAEGDYDLRYNFSHDYDINFQLTNGTVGISDYSPEVRCYLDVYINGALYNSDLMYVASSPSQAYPFAGFNFNVAGMYQKDLYLDVSDTVEIRLRSELTTIVQAPSLNTILSSNDVGEYTFQLSSNASSLDLSYVQETIVTGAEVNIKSFLPKMDGATFFKGLVNMFNLYVQPDPLNNKNLLIEPLNTFYNGSDNAINWSDKLDHSKPIKVTPTINFSTKEYIFGFQEDKDYWNERYFGDVIEQYGSKNLESSSQFATGKTEIKLPFSNKVLHEIPTTDLNVPTCYTVKTDQNGISEITPKRGKPFIVQIKKGNVITGENMQAGVWNHIDETATDNIQAEYPYVGHLDSIDDPTFDLMFGLPSYVFYDIATGVTYTTNNLYIYHEKFIKEILDKDGKMMTAFMNLTPTDINQLDFGDLINIHGVVYRLNKIENYDSKEDKSTKCEFIKIIEGESIQTNTLTELTPGLENNDPYGTPSEINRRATESGDIRDTEDGTDQRIIG